MPLATQTSKLAKWQVDALMLRMDANTSQFVTYEEFENFMQVSLRRNAHTPNKPCRRNPNRL